MTVRLATRSAPGRPASPSEPVSLKDKIEDALDEARMMVLGAQVLVGFQYSAFFHSGFERLSRGAQELLAVALAAMLVVAALVMSPAPLHRIGQDGNDTARMHRYTTRVMEAALAPFTLALGVNLFAVSERLLGGAGAGVFGGVAALVAGGFWFAAGRLGRQHTIGSGAMMETATPLKAKIQQMLTEARVILPGVQALLGFQFTAMLTDTYEKLDRPLQILHLASLGAMALAVVLLMAPAPFHRLAAGGEATARVNRFGVCVLIAALVPLALGMAGDFFLVLQLVWRSTTVAAAGTGALLAAFAGLWFGYPLWVRRTR
jgi:hypothetical protein